MKFHPSFLCSNIVRIKSFSAKLHQFVDHFKQLANTTGQFAQDFDYELETLTTSWIKSTKQADLTCQSIY